MKKNISYAVIIALLFFACKAGLESYTVINERHNLSENKISIDTNKYDKLIVRSIFSRIEINEGNTVLLVGPRNKGEKVVEFGLYDLRNRKFWYSASGEAHLFFTDIRTPESEAMLEAIRPVTFNAVVQEDKMKQFVKTHKDFSISIVKVNSNKREIFIKTFQ